MYGQEAVSIVSSWRWRCGEDNELQLTGTLGALRLAERWSDMYIMAPQAPSGNLGMQEMFEVMKKRGNPFSADMGTHRFL